MSLQREITLQFRIFKTNYLTLHFCVFITKCKIEKNLCTVKVVHVLTRASPMTKKNHAIDQKMKGKRQHKDVTKTQRLRTDLGRLVGAYNFI